MPEYPEKKSETKSTSNYSVSFGGGIPIVRSINSYMLGKDGWEWCSGSVYKKNGRELKFDGVHWVMDGKRFEFMHELKHEINKRNNGDNS